MQNRLVRRPTRTQNNPKREWNMNRSLTARQRQFVTEYLHDFNATKAATRAGYSPKTARFQAGRLLTNVNIEAAIEESQVKAFASAEVTIERVIAEYARLAFLDPAAFFSANGDLLPIAEIPKDARRAIAGIEVEEIFAGRGEERRHIGRLHKIRFAHKIQALDSLAKHLGMFTERLASADNGGFQIRIFSYRDAESDVS
jgi:phage terminase small subunit